MDDGTDPRGRSFTGRDDDESIFTIGCEAHTPRMDKLYGFGEQDGNFTDHFFDFESACCSPGPWAGGQIALASPCMATVQTNSPQKTASRACTNKPKTGSYKKKKSVRLLMFQLFYTITSRLLFYF